MEKGLYAIIVAGGQGTRMRSEIPKQFILLNAKPILLHTLSRFSSFTLPIKIILVLPSQEIEAWKNIIQQFNISITNITIVSGGSSRFHSVYNGLQLLNDIEGLVSIHDGVRPFITKELIESTYRLAMEKGSAVTAVPMKDSIRKVNAEGSSISVDRKEYFLVQTPQVFPINTIKNAYAVAPTDNFTDDASVAEHSGVKINILEGSYDNIKITTPEDLILAEVLLKKFKY